MTISRRFSFSGFGLVAVWTWLANRFLCSSFCLLVDVIEEVETSKTWLLEYEDLNPPYERQRLFVFERERERRRVL